MNEPIANPAAAVADVHAAIKVASPALRTGLYTGALLIMVMAGSLVAANRLSWLDNRALERNAASYGLFVIFMLIPIFRFVTRPVKMFVSAMIAWFFFVIAYDIAGFFFHNLFEALRTPFEALLEGAVIYGVCAVGSWVGGMAVQARQQPIAPRRRRRSDFISSHHP